MDSISILNTVKAVVGIEETSTDFDAGLIIHINTVFSIFNSMGIGPDSPFIVVTGTETWSDFFGEEGTTDEAIKTLLALKVKQVFDPPVTSFLSDSINRSISELEWRLHFSYNKETIIDEEGETNE